MMMARADKMFFINFRKEINRDNEPVSLLDTMIIPRVYAAGSEPKGCLIYASENIASQEKTSKEEAYDEICKQNIELSNEIAILKKANRELQNKLDAVQSTNQGKSDNVVSLESFIRFIEESSDEEEIKTIRNLGRAFFDGEAKMRINQAANNQLAKLKSPSTINNNFNSPVATMVAHTDEITFKHEEP